MARTCVPLRPSVAGDRSLRVDAVGYNAFATEIIGHSPVMRRVLEQIALVAPTEATVLIQGESGTGKELAARAIHDNSWRRTRPLVRVNCGSISRELFESEFFGHCKGAFTGAIRDRSGRFELADQGTLFLDEVGEIPLDLQSKLLRVLQEGQYERVGEDQTRQVDVRLVAATNRDLRSEVSQGRFREDLYYRLCVFPLEIPPLRARMEDVEFLGRQLIAAACRRLRVPQALLSAQALAQLRAHSWPGNVRELQNAIERAVIICVSGDLCFDFLAPVDAKFDHRVPSATTRCETPYLTEQSWLQLEQENLSAVLQHAGGRVGGPGGAAELMGIRPTTFRSRLKALRLSEPNR